MERAKRRAYMLDVNSQLSPVDVEAEFDVTSQVGGFVLFFVFFFVCAKQRSRCGRWRRSMWCD